MSSIVFASCDDTLRIDDEGRRMLSKRMLRLEQAPHTNRAQLRQWCLRFVKLKAWWQSRQCWLAPSSIHSLRGGVGTSWLASAVLSARPEAVWQRKRGIGSLTWASLQARLSWGTALAFVLRLCAG